MPDETLFLANKVANAVDTRLSYWGADLRCRFANAAYESCFGIPPHKMLGISTDLFLGTYYEEAVPRILGVLKGEAQVFERAITLPSGMMRHDLVSFHPDVAGGIVQGFTVHATDNNRVKQLKFELEKSEKRVELLASHDFLTSLPNRYLLIDRISGLLSQAESSGTLLVLQL